MSVRFDPDHNLIVVQAKFWGPRGSAVLRLALDTGATSTLINAAPLVTLGYDPSLVEDRLQVTTGSSVEFVSRIELERICALQQERIGFSVLCHTLPPSTGVDGLLGLNFFRGQYLTIDFRDGLIGLS